MRKITADWVIPVSSEPVKNGVIILDDHGEVLEVSPAGIYDVTELEKYDGILIPGFINTHCHLELSHMKDQVVPGLGLVSFIKEVVGKRNFDEDVILDAIAKADKEMCENGIVAVGDISNMKHSFETKQKSKLQYHTFVEFFDLLNPMWTQRSIDQYTEIFINAPQNHPHSRSAVPHASYSVTPELFKAINKLNTDAKVVSIHNEETQAENELFRYKTGPFVDFYNSIGNDLKSFQAIGLSAVHYASEYMDTSIPTLLVHNTMMEKGDIEYAEATFDQLYWCTCPNANIYIEGKLPDYKQFKDLDAKMTIGTDSLTSNWQLSILEEMKTIERHHPEIPVFEMITWATLNGATALGFDKNLGSIEIGKTPGIVLIVDCLDNNVISLQKSQLQRLI